MNPLVADRYTPAAVHIVSRVVLVIAAFIHSQPNFIWARMAHFMLVVGFKVNPVLLLFHASAGLYRPALQAV